MDLIDRQLVDALQENARASWAELGRLVNLSGPSVQDRVRRLEERGVIQGYRAVLRPAAVGWGVSALIDVYPGDTVGTAEVAAALQALAEVEDCWHVAGDAEFVVKVRAPDVAGLEVVVGTVRQVRGVVRTRTTVVLSTYWEGRPLPVDVPGGERP